MADDAPEQGDVEVPQPEAAEPQATDEVAEVDASSEPQDADADQTAAAEPVADAPAAESDLPELEIGSEALPEDVEDRPAPTIRGKIDKFGVAMGTGRRKTSVARVRIKEGNGDLSINGRSLENYCAIQRDRLNILAPLKATETEGKVDVWVRVDGGGTTGQAGAIVLGIARALQAMDAGYHHTLADGGFLTRDSRMVERKKYGFRKARRSFQFSKR